MAAAKVFIHLGLQKTASTFLQEQVWPNIPDVCYLGRPYTQENQAFNALQYADGSLYDPAQFRAEIAAVRSQHPHQPLLLSDELFSGFAFYGVVNRSLIAKRLAEALPDAEIILFLRAQADLVESLYNQFVKIGWYARYLDDAFLCGRGRGLSYASWRNGSKAWSMENRDFRHTGVFSARHFLYTPLIELYTSLFPKVHVFLFEDLLDSPDTCFERLSQIIDRPIPRPEQRGEATVNPSVSSAALHERLIANRLAMAFPDQALPGWLQPMAKSVLMRGSRPQSAQQRQLFIVQTLDSVGVFADNRQLDARMSLGMSGYSEKYFAPLCAE